MKNLVVLTALFIAFSSCATKKEQAKAKNEKQLSSKIVVAGSIVKVLEKDSAGNVVIIYDEPPVKYNHTQPSSFGAKASSAKNLEERDKDIRSDDPRSGRDRYN